MTEKTLTTENIRPALDALRGELAPWPVVAKKQDRLNTAQLNAANSGITSSLVAQIIANTAAIRALESAITGTGLRALVVATLPAVGTTGILYIVPVTTYDPDTDADVVNYSNEYIWIPVEAGTASEGYYEQVGQTGIVINNGQLTITVNGTSVGTFTANQSGDTTAAITVPTNADYVDRTTDQTVAGVKTFSSTINGTASKAIADEDGTSIKTGYVNVAGNQTISGQKIWTQAQVFQNNVYLANTSYTVGTIPASNITSTCFFSGASNYQIGYCRSVVYKTTGQTSAELTARNKFTNGALDPNGDYTNATFTVNLDAEGTRWIQFANSSIKNGLTPYTTDTYNIGSATNQWLRLFAKFYYYNGVAWGLDQANTWTDTQSFKDSAYTQGVSVTDRKQDIWKVTDSTDTAFGTWEAIQYTDGRQGFRLCTSNKYKNGNLDPTGNIVPVYFEFLQRPEDGSSVLSWTNGFINNSVYPLVPNTFTLGNALFQWSSVYAQSYYYNGTEFRNKFVTTDTNQEIGGTKAFTGSIRPYGLITHLNQSLEKGTIPSSNKYGGIIYNDKTFANNVTHRFADQVATVDSTGTSAISLAAYKWETNSQLKTEIVLGYPLQGNTFVRMNTDEVTPNTTAVTDLGTSTNKWKSLNGINPGALSLPNGNAQDISWIGDLTIKDGSGYNLKTFTLNGWITINIPNTAGNLVVINNGCGQIVTNEAKGATGSNCSVFIPVVANVQVSILLVLQTGESVKTAIFVPCLGNV